MYSLGNSQNRHFDCQESRDIKVGHRCPSLFINLRRRLRSTNIFCSAKRLREITAMLLVACPACRREISGSPNLCPNCGAALGETVLKHCKLWLRIGKILAGLGTALAILGFFHAAGASSGAIGWLLIFVGLVVTFWARYSSRQYQS